MSDRHTILVVDDEADVVKSVKDLLRFDYNVIGATSAAEAMKLLGQHDGEVDVIMTDQRMPEMTGVQLLRQARGTHPEATRLLFTGYADLRAVIDAINQGNVYRYVTKPWDPDELISIIREACERHDLLVQRQQLTDELERKNAELQSANDELKQADALKLAFIRVASHELRTPITILLGLLDLAMITPGCPPPITDLLTRVRRAGKRLMHLVDQLVTMLAAGQFARPLLRERVDLAKLLDDAVADVEPFVALRQQRLAREWDPSLGEIEIDAPKIRDSINHVLLNAVKFTPDEGKIAVSARRVGDEVHIKITDTGIGIDPAELPRMCEPFFTGIDVSHHTSGTHEFCRRGIGLGLSTVKSFVEMHGGRVAIESAKDSGTTVTLILPQVSSL
jgi:signal transduction histidine kinase